MLAIKTKDDIAASRRGFFTPARCFDHLLSEAREDLSDMLIRADHDTVLLQYPDKKRELRFASGCLNYRPFMDLRMYQTYDDHSFDFKKSPFGFNLAGYEDIRTFKTNMPKLELGIQSRPRFEEIKCKLALDMATRFVAYCDTARVKSIQTNSANSVDDYSFIRESCIIFVTRGLLCQETYSNVYDLWCSEAKLDIRPPFSSVVEKCMGRAVDKVIEILKDRNRKDKNRLNVPPSVKKRKLVEEEEASDEEMQIVRPRGSRKSRLIIEEDEEMTEKEEEVYIPPAVRAKPNPKPDDVVGVTFDSVHHPFSKKTRYDSGENKPGGMASNIAIHWSTDMLKKHAEPECLIYARDVMDQQCSDRADAKRRGEDE